MQMTTQPSTASVIGRGVVAGVAGTVVMTAFQKFVEMPLTKRGESDAPADFARGSRRSIPIRRRVGGV